MSFGRRLNTIERVWFRLVKTVTAGDVLAKYWLTTQWSKAALDQYHYYLTGLT